MTPTWIQLPGWRRQPVIRDLWFIAQSDRRTRKILRGPTPMKTLDAWHKPEENARIAFPKSSSSSGIAHPCDGINGKRGGGFYGAYICTDDCIIVGLGSHYVGFRTGCAGD